MNNTSIINSVVKTLPAFLATARTTNFAKASIILGIPKKTIIRYISQLEENLEVTLFTRQRNQLYLTKEGKKLFCATSSSLGHIVTTLHGISHNLEPLIIGCPQELYSWLTQRLKTLQQFLPNTEIELITHDGCHWYNQQNIDIIFAYGMGNWQGVESYLLFEEEVFPVCSPALAEKYSLLNDPVSPEQLVNLPLIHGSWTVGRSWQNWFAGFNVACGQDYDKKMQQTSYLMSLELAKQGEGVALAWSGVFEPQLYDNLLIEIPQLRLKSNIGYYMILQPETSFADIAKKWWRLIS